MVSAEFCFLEQKTSVQNPEIEASVYAFWFLCFFINFCKKQKTERAKNIFSTVNCNTGAVRFVDLLKEGVVSHEEYERLVEPIRARKRRAEQMAEREGRPPSVRTGAVHRWTPAALASYESSTMQGGESADKAPG